MPHARMRLPEFRTTGDAEGCRIVIMSMMGCPPCETLESRLSALELACPVIHVSCRPTEARQLISDGEVVAFPTMRVMNGGQIFYELVGFPPQHNDQTAELHRLLTAAGVTDEAAAEQLNG